MKPFPRVKRRERFEHEGALGTTQQARVDYEPVALVQVPQGMWHGTGDLGPVRHL